MPSRAHWRQVLRTVRSEAFSDHLLMAAAGVAFHALFGLLPAVAAAATLWRLAVGPQPIETFAQDLPSDLPGEVGEVVAELLVAIPEGFGLGLSLAVNLAVVLWTAQRAASGLVSALNLAYDEDERRSFLHRSLVALAVAVGGILLLLAALTVLVAGSVFATGLPEPWRSLLRWGRWPLLASGFGVGLALLYAYAPCRSGTRWRWVAQGAAAGTLLWLVSSVGLAVYAENLGAYGRYYGSLGAAVLLLLWFYLSGLSVLVGAEFNAALAEARGERRPSETKRRLKQREGKR